jgi:hypothetical protein
MVMGRAPMRSVRAAGAAARRVELAPMTGVLLGGLFAETGTTPTGLRDRRTRRTRSEPRPGQRVTAVVDELFLPLLARYRAD